MGILILMPEYEPGQPLAENLAGMTDNKLQTRVDATSLPPVEMLLQ